MTIKHLGGIFGRNPEFNDVTIDGKLGIGVDSPTQDLEVSGAIQAGDYRSSANLFLTYNTSNSLRVRQSSGVEAYRIDNNRNLLLGGTASPASSVGNLAMFNGQAPSASVTNGIVLYAEDVSASSELKVRDEAGNVTTLSPHNFELIPEGPSEDMAWSYYSEKDGKRINVDMLKAIRVLEKMSGEQLVYEE